MGMILIRRATEIKRGGLQISNSRPSKVTSEHIEKLSVLLTGRMGLCQCVSIKRFRCAAGESNRNTLCIYMAAKLLLNAFHICSSYEHVCLKGEKPHSKLFLRTCRGLAFCPHSCLTLAQLLAASKSFFIRRLGLARKLELL